MESGSHYSICCNSLKNSKKFDRSRASNTINFELIFNYTAPNWNDNRRNKIINDNAKKKNTKQKHGKILNLAKNDKKKRPSLSNINNYCQNGNNNNTKTINNKTKTISKTNKKNLYINEYIFITFWMVTKQCKNGNKKKINTIRFNTVRQKLFQMAFKLLFCRFLSFFFSL